MHLRHIFSHLLQPRLKISLIEFIKFLVTSYKVLTKSNNFNRASIPYILLTQVDYSIVPGNSIRAFWTPKFSQLRYSMNKWLNLPNKECSLWYVSSVFISGTIALLKKYWYFSIFLSLRSFKYKLFLSSSIY